MARRKPWAVPMDLRALLVGDVLARTAELHGLQSRTFLTTPHLPREQAWPRGSWTPSPRGADPLAVRLLMLCHAYRTPVTAAGTALEEARRTLGHWQLVADWAQDTLVTVAARADVPGGVTFETFAFLDRVLGLDLAREVGHQHRAAP